MENSVKTLTIGAVAIAGIICGGLPAVFAEATVAFIYVIIKNC